MTPMEVLFYICSINVILSGIIVIGSRNPIYSVLFLILLFINSVGIFLLLEFDFLAMLFLIVYVGAIAILFLFVIMMLNIKNVELNNLKHLPIAIIIVLLFLAQLLFVFDNNLLLLNMDSNYLHVTWHLNQKLFDNIYVIGLVIYTHYFYVLIILSLILLVAMIGVIVLTLKQSIKSTQQIIYNQVYRNIYKSIFLKK